MSLSLFDRNKKARLKTSRRENLGTRLVIESDTLFTQSSAIVDHIILKDIF